MENRKKLEILGKNRGKRRNSTRKISTRETQHTDNTQTPFTHDKSYLLNTVLWQKESKKNVAKKK